jgi:acyl-CoA thioester hydrolase
MDKLKDFNFTMEMWVPFDDVDMGGIVHNSKYILYFERCRTKYFHSLGIHLVPPDPGLFFVVKKHEIEYISPARFNEILQCGASIYHFGKSSFRFRYLIINKETGMEIVKGMSVIVNIHPGEFKSYPLPDWFRERIASREGEGIFTSPP